LKEYDQELVSAVTEFNPDLTQWCDREYFSYSKTDKKYDDLIMNSVGGFDAFFKTKEEAKTFDYSPHIANLKPNTSSYRNKIDVSHIGQRDYSYRYRDTVISENAIQTLKIVDER